MRMKNCLFALLLIWLLLATPVHADRLFTCGFEENDIGPGITMWTANTGSASVQTTTVRSGTYAARINPSGASGQIRKNLFANKTTGTIWTRFYYRVAAVPAADTRILHHQNSSGSTFVRVILLSTGKLRIENVVTTTTADSTITLVANTWYRIELRHLLSDTVGEIELFVDGNSEASITGEDTLNTNLRQILFGTSSGSTIDSFYDDIGINDEAGTFQNGLPGAGNISFVDPDGDDTVAWTAVPGTPNAGNVDELPGAVPDDLTSYNHISNLTSVDKLTLQNLGAAVPSDADLILADVYGRQGSDGTSGQRSIIYRIWDDTDTSTDSARVSVDINGWRISDTDEHLVLDLGAKTKANFDSFKIGYKGNEGNNLKRITAQWVNVEWIEAAAAPAFRPKVVVY